MFIIGFMGLNFVFLLTIVFLLKTNLNILINRNNILMFLNFVCFC
ncbi:hypothetical protein GUU_03895 [Malacoplasma iowae 695]|nr:hypothetical protein GUU_03895 [Malacoplasma iowae 695]